METQSEPNLYLKKYFHVDNGGHTFSFEDGQIVINTSFFGYTDTTVKLNNLTPKNYREIAEMFIIEARRMESDNES